MLAAASASRIPKRVAYLHNFTVKYVYSFPHCEQYVFIAEKSKTSQSAVISFTVTNVAALESAVH